jgi:large subunit ribosomal protein L29
MDTIELRALTAEELSKKAADLERQLFDLRMKLKSGRLDSPADIQKARRELAQANTLIRERELGIKREGK